MSKTIDMQGCVTGVDQMFTSRLFSIGRSQLSAEMQALHVISQDAEKSFKKYIYLSKVDIFIRSYFSS